MSLINLLPDDYLRRRAQRRANLLCIALFAVVMVAVLTAAAISETSYRHTREVCEKVNSEYAEAEKRIQEYQDLEATRAKMYEKANRTTSLLEKMPRSNIMAALTDALPEGASLVKVELKMTHGAVVVNKSLNKYDQEKAKTAAAVAVKEQQHVATLTVTGLAGTDVEVAKFIACMAQCPLVETPELIYSQEKKVSESAVREFQVVMQLRLEPEPPKCAAVTSIKPGGPS